MAAELYREDTVFRQWLQIGDDLVRAHSGVSVIDALYDTDRSPADPFSLLEETHPAIFLIQYALAKFLLNNGVRPDQLMGVSLGEFTAMALSEMTAFDQALEVICAQPGIFQKTCQPGGMIGVLGNPELHSDLPGESEIAGINADNHFVIAALTNTLDDIEGALTSRNVAAQRLAVPFAFHSKWIEPAAEELVKVFPGACKPPRWPIWSSRSASQIGLPDKEFFWQTARRPMRVRDTIRNIEKNGGAIYVDLGPSGTLAAILPQVLKPDTPSRILGILSPFGGLKKRLEAVLSLASS
ncbi:MAG: acyltransferase domain-containing protein [Rhodospirillaceae bacterium]|jgi:bacillaene synthase trans-acting acyltransferase|nr:acyltransferase domain-containing protein [Rhodospirillaceae bacterium]